MEKMFYAVVCLVLSSMGIYCSSCKSSDSNAKNDVDTTLTNVIHPEWSRRAVIYEVNLRQYTTEGTIKAFEKHLNRLKDIGVDVLWFMPVHPISEKNRKGELGSYYAVKDYTAVNPEFGTLDDFKELVDMAHKKSMKVIIDWVANHSGCDNVWVAEHPDWYATDSVGKMYGPFDWTDVYKFDYSNKQMRKGMIDAMKFWVSETDIDGFRCDVAGEVPTDFWEEARDSLDVVKPIFLLAEASKPELAKNAFDMSYNWPMKDLFGEIARTQGVNAMPLRKGEKKVVKNALSIDSLLALQEKTYPTDSYMMNMITNHDLNSWEGTEFERFGDAVDAFAVLTYVLPGTPLIYTGQETGMDRAFEFFKKDTPPDWLPNKYYNFYQKLNALKHGYSIFAAGTEGAPIVRYHTENPNLFIFSRGNDDCSAYIFMNLSSGETDIKYTEAAPDRKVGVNFFSGVEEDFPTKLKPWEYRIYAYKH